MKIVFAIILSLLLSTSASFAASDSDASPVMIIRLNQELVSYQKSLQKIADSALEAKPNVVFDIVSLTPEKGDRKQKERSEMLTREVSQTLQSYKVKPEQIQVTTQKSADVQAGEVRIFLR